MSLRPTVVVSEPPDMYFAKDSVLFSADRFAWQQLGRLKRMSIANADVRVVTLARLLQADEPTLWYSCRSAGQQYDMVWLLQLAPRYSRSSS
jgi:hypothetical protein